MEPIEFIGPALRLTFLVDKRINELLKTHLHVGLSSIKMLFLLKEHPRAHNSFIAKAWGMTDAAVSRQMNILVRKKMVTVQQVPGLGRVRSYVMTKEGLQCTRKAQQIIKTELSVLFAPMTERNKKQFVTSVSQALACVSAAGYGDSLLFLKRKSSLLKHT